jgi:hypothetical protein
MFALPNSSTSNPSSRDTSKQNHTSNNQQQLTVTNRFQIPTGPSNLTTYTCRYESWEHLAIGKPTSRSKESMARELAEWEMRWERVDGS